MNLENYLQDKFKLYDSLHKFNILLDIQGTPCARVALACLLGMFWHFG